MGKVYEVVVTEGAQKEIRQLYDYLVETVSEVTAEHVKDGILEEIKKLSKMPESRGLLRGLQSKRAYRRVNKWSYRIIFTIEKDQVLVVRIDHSKRNPSKLGDLL